MTELALPKVDKKIIERKDEIVKNLSKISGSDNVLSHPDEIKPYETDALAAYTQTPLSVILPKDTNEVSEILKYCHKENIKVIPRGAGTGLSGGALPLQDAVILGLGKFNKILDIDYENKCVVTQPGVTNLGTESEVNELLKKVSEISKKNNCSSLKLSKNEEERLKFWAGRKAAFPACGAMAPDYYCMDGVIPRGKLAEALIEIRKLSDKYKLLVANCFHAGDGNLHPLIMFDGSDKEQLRKTEEFGAEILKLCVKLGGVITGEHGVGIEKRELMCEMFNDRDIQQQLDIKKSLDEKNLLNPGKVYPILRKCAEEGRVHVHKNENKFQIFQDSNNTYYPKDEEEVSILIKEFYKKNLPTEIVGTNTKSFIGNKTQASNKISLSKLSGIIDYFPEELYIKVKAGTPLEDVEKALEKNNQELGI
jgi:FAD/FMN-containing dehydrogenase